MIFFFIWKEKIAVFKIIILVYVDLYYVYNYKKKKESNFFLEYINEKKNKL